MLPSISIDNGIWRHCSFVASAESSDDFDGSEWLRWQRRRDAFAEVLDPFSRNNVRWKRRRDAFAEVLDHLIALAEALALEWRLGCP